jgi:hypothetical protein
MSEAEKIAESIKRKEEGNELFKKGSFETAHRKYSKVRNFIEISSEFSLTFLIGSGIFRIYL